MTSEGYRTVQDVVQDICRRAEKENFEDGVSSGFTEALDVFLKARGRLVITSLGWLILCEEINQGVAAEALRWLGRLDHEESYKIRYRILCICLYDDSLFIRDAALLGIASLGDPSAIPHLESAKLSTESEELCGDIAQVIEHLTEIDRQRQELGVESDIVVRMPIYFRRAKFKVRHSDPVKPRFVGDNLPEE